MFRVDRRVAVRTPEVTIRAAHPVATIGKQVRLDTRRVDDTVRDGMVNAFDRVPAELGCQQPLGLGGPREYHHAARIFVQPMHDAELGVDALFVDPSQQRSCVVDERFLVTCFVGNAQYPNGLVDNHDVGVVENNGTLRKRAAAELGPMRVDDKHRTACDPRCRVEAALAIQRDVTFRA